MSKIEILLAALVVVMGVQSVFAADAPAWHEPDTLSTQPGVFFYLFQTDAQWKQGVFSAEHHATADCVTPPVAFECSFPAVDGPAGVLEFELDHTLPVDSSGSYIPADAVGISFYIRGDGSKGKARIELRTDYVVPGAGVDLPLDDKSWHRVMLRWEDFSPAPDLAKTIMLCFSVAPDTTRPAWYTIDVVRIVKTVDEDPSVTALAAAANERTEAPSIPYRVSPGACAYNKGALAKVRDRMRRGEPVKWLSYGDSVTVPVQLWNIPEELHQTQYAYYAVAANMLQSEYGCRIDSTVNALGGRLLHERFDNLLTSLDTVRPDVVVMFTWDTRENYALYMPQALAKAAAVGAELLVVIPTYDVAPYRDPAFDWLRQWCIENNVACADARTYLLCTGENFWGDTISNHAHLNALGHRLVGQVVAEMFR